MNEIQKITERKPIEWKNQVACDSIVFPPIILFYTLNVCNFINFNIVQLVCNVKKSF